MTNILKNILVLAKSAERSKSVSLNNKKKKKTEAAIIQILNRSLEAKIVRHFGILLEIEGYD
jgi:hypothetical protein